MTPADPCTGARWRDFLLGIRRGQPVGAHVPSWCSRHEVDGWLLPTGGPAWLTYDFCLPDAADGTGGRPHGIECQNWSCEQPTGAARDESAPLQEVLDWVGLSRPYIWVGIQVIPMPND